jgi:hypothetical protein
MKLIKRIGFQFAIKTILGISAFTIIFHLLILSEAISYKIVWGGRLENTEQMRLFEAFSIAINLLIALLVAMKGGYLKPVLPEKLERVILWGFAILFSLNTVGNLLAVNSLETMIFTPITMLLAVLFLRITVEANGRKPRTAISKWK